MGKCPQEIRSCTGTSFSTKKHPGLLPYYPVSQQRRVVGWVLVQDRAKLEVKDKLLPNHSKVPLPISAGFISLLA